MRRRWARLLLFTAFNLMASTAAANPAEEQVVLLPGIAKQARDMTPLAEALNEAGYIVLNRDYPSRKAPIEVLAASLLDQV